MDPQESQDGTPLAPFTKPKRGVSFADPQVETSESLNASAGAIISNDTCRKGLF